MPKKRRDFSFSKQLYWSSLTNTGTPPHSHSHPRHCGFACNGRNTVTMEPSPVCRIAGNFPGLPGPATSRHYVLPGFGSKHLQNLAGPTPSHLGISLTGIKPRVPNCRWILYQLSHQGSPHLCNMALKLPHIQESACSEGDLGSTPGLGRSPGEGTGTPLQYSCLETPTDRAACTDYCPWGRKSWAQLSN